MYGWSSASSANCNVPFSPGPPCRARKTITVGSSNRSDVKRATLACGLQGALLGLALGLAGVAVRRMAGAAPVAAAERPEKRPVDRALPKRKLGFNERRALETLPRRIEELRADLVALERQLADADFATREPPAFLGAMKAYAEVRDALAGAEDEWLGLEILREELERQ